MNYPFNIVSSDVFLDLLNDSAAQPNNIEEDFQVEEEWMFQQELSQQQQSQQQQPLQVERSKALIGNELLQKIKKQSDQDLIKNNKEVFQANQSKSIYLNKISQLIEQPHNICKPKQTRQKVIVESDSSDCGKNRLAKNRESARNSRKRKKIYVELLEQKVRELTDQIRQLEYEIQQNKIRNQQLDNFLTDYHQAIINLNDSNSIVKLQEEYGVSSPKRWSVCTELINLLIESTIPYELKKIMESAKNGNDMFAIPLLNTTNNNNCINQRDSIIQGTQELEIANKNFGIAYDKVREQIFKLEKTKIDVIQIIEILKKTISFVQKSLVNAESGHDYFHIQRVLNIALTIAKEEQKTRIIDLDLVQLGALLHDIADHKFHNGDESIGPQIAREFLIKDCNATEELTNKVVDIIKQISYKGANVEDQMSTYEGKIVQDADRLDALGSIGIARCFTYGGYKNRKLYDPQIKPQLHKDFQEYKNNQSTTINHFYEKLLLLKDRMNTPTGIKMAEQRHKIMEDYLNNFLKEWEGIQ